MSDEQLTIGGDPELFARWRPATDERHAMLIVHGYGEHGGRYRALAEAGCEHGISSLTIDYRGFGRAAGRRAFVRSFDEYLDDVQRGLDELARHTPHSPVLFGHSQGGLIAAHFATTRRHDLAGLILGCPALRFALPIPAWKRGIALLLSRAWPTLAMPAEVDPELLTHDQAAMAAMRDDELMVRHATVRWYTESLRAQRAVLAHADRLATPLLMLLAGDDGVVANDAADDLFARCRSQDKQKLVYEGARHELLNELRATRTTVTHDLLGWVQKRATPR